MLLMEMMPAAETTRSTECTTRGKRMKPLGSAGRAICSHQSQLHLLSCRRDKERLNFSVRCTAALRSPSRRHFRAMEAPRIIAEMTCIAKESVCKVTRTAVLLFFGALRSRKI